PGGDAGRARGAPPDDERPQVALDREEEADAGEGDEAERREDGGIGMEAEPHPLADPPQAGGRHRVADEDEEADIERDARAGRAHRREDETGGEQRETRREPRRVVEKDGNRTHGRPTPRSRLSRAPATPACGRSRAPPRPPAPTSPWRPEAD